MNGTNRYVWQQNQSITHEWMTKGEKKRIEIWLVSALNRVDFVQVLRNSHTVCALWASSCMLILATYHHDAKASRFGRAKINICDEQKYGVSENWKIKFTILLSILSGIVRGNAAAAVFCCQFSFEHRLHTHSRSILHCSRFSLAFLSYFVCPMRS